MLNLFSKENRTGKAKRNILYMLLIKGTGILINLAFVSLLIDILDIQNYGIWITITTILGWISFFDIGLGHGLRNKLAESIAKKNDTLSRQYVSTTYITLAFGVVGLITIQLICMPFINWANVLNAPQEMNDELSLLVSWVVFLVSIQFLFKLITSIMLAFQMPAFSSLIVTAGQLLAFLVIYFSTKVDLEFSMLQLGLIVSSAPLVIMFVASILVFKGKYKMYSPSLGHFRRDLIKPVLLLGMRFFSIQITAMLLFQSDTIIIAHVAGPESVTEFSIAFKYIGVINMIFTIISIPFWSATTDAYYRKDFEWIRKTINTLSKYWLLMVLGGILMTIAAPFFYNLWLGDSLKVNPELMILIFIYYLFYLRWVMYGSIINGIGKIKLQFYVTLIEVIVHIPTALVFGAFWGVNGVIVSMILVGVINSIWPPIQLKKILNNSARGVWNK